MFELADSGSSGDLPLLCSPLLLSLPLALSLPPSLSSSLSLSHLSTCYATLLCHAASAAQVCGHVGTRKRTPPSQRLHLSTFLFLLSQPTHALPLSLYLAMYPPRLLSTGGLLFLSFSSLFFLALPFPSR